MEKRRQRERSNIKKQKTPIKQTKEKQKKSEERNRKARENEPADNRLVSVCSPISMPVNERATCPDNSSPKHSKAATHSERNRL
jgi:hypothetical protein